MTDKELRKLRREELLEMLIEQGRKVESLQEQLEEMQKKLDDREIRINQAGDIAEASLQINGVFEAAQSAARQYLENIQRLSGRQEEICTELERSIREQCADTERSTRERCEAMERETEARCEAIERECEEKCQTMKRETEENCRILRQNAQKEADARWADLETRLEGFYNAHKGLRELMAAAGGIKLE
ncbi:MAG: hypothetical protein Q4C52_05175 [Eubacteriales bacterium]|nr:hypothetical protein [Eubacteriales bacterium]